MATDTSERGLERLICAALTGAPCDPGAPVNTAQERPATYAAGWRCGIPEDYDREYCVDLVQLAAFLRETQPETAEALDLGDDGPTRRKFLARLQGEVSKRGTIDVLRHGIKHGPHHIDLFYGTPSPGNAKAAELNKSNRFSVTRQLRYSRDEMQRALDLGLCINGLPVATFELKNSLTKQTVDDAVQQYQRDRDPREKLFEFGRCVAHFAVDDHEVRFCTHLKGKGSWFLPFNQGWNDGAGNPPNPNGLKTDYLWKNILTRAGLTDILENYAQVIETRDEKTGRKKAVQVWPRFHQLDVVRRLLADAQVSVDAGRLETELAILADKSDITEELVRLRSHFEQFRALLSAKVPVGRRMDFLLQEIGREVNTIGSKSQDSDLAQHVVALKAEVERMREQVQNVE